VCLFYCACIYVRQEIWGASKLQATLLKVLCVYVFVCVCVCMCVCVFGLLCVHFGTPGNMGRKQTASDAAEGGVYVFVCLFVCLFVCAC